LVFFGITGDLAFKQIFPALQALIRRTRLDVPIIGIARSASSHEQLCSRAHASLEAHGGVDAEAFGKLCARLRYIAGDYGDAATYERLRAALGAARRPLHYLAIPPSLFVTVALRDVVQNHLLQVTGLLAMEAPIHHHPDSARDERLRVFKAMRPLKPADLVRGQFRGYRNEPGVAAHSQVETFVALRLHIDTWRWEGVPFYIRAGKRLPVTTTEVIVELKRPPLSVFDAIAPGQSNRFRFRLSPDVFIAVSARVKAPGEAMVGQDVELIARRHPGDEMMPYERLLGDAIRGDASLFASHDSIEATWRVVDPVLSGMPPPIEYDPGSWGPVEADRIITGNGAWRNPESTDVLVT
jgi:glucose-6-phosphate 1-dehydrogenase